MKTAVITFLYLALSASCAMAQDFKCDFTSMNEQCFQRIMDNFCSLRNKVGDLVYNADRPNHVPVRPAPNSSLAWKMFSAFVAARGEKIAPQVFKEQMNETDFLFATKMLNGCLSRHKTISAKYFQDLYKAWHDKLAAMQFKLDCAGAVVLETERHFLDMINDGRVAN